MSCPICGKPVTPDYRPFCSRRCADVDLGRWLNESYRVPAESEDEPEDEAFGEGFDKASDKAGTKTPPKAH